LLKTTAPGRFTIRFEQINRTWHRNDQEARNIEALGRLLMRSDTVTNIEVLDANGADVTDTFACFQ
jgi:hypothetical protein